MPEVGLGWVGGGYRESQNVTRLAARSTQRSTVANVIGKILKSALRFSVIPYDPVVSGHPHNVIFFPRLTCNVIVTTKGNWVTTKG